MAYNMTRHSWDMREGNAGYRYNPAIGNNPLPPGTQGTVNKAYTHTPQQQEMVNYQLNGLLDQNGRYLQNARLRANEGSNARGLLNSSMAMGNAERAAIESAMPIAQADAARYGQSAESNLGYLNQMAQQEGQLASAESIARANRNAANAGAGAQISAALQRQREALAFQGEQAGLDRNQQLGMAQFGLGADLTRMGGAAQWNNWLGGQDNARGMERDLYQTQLQSIGNYGQTMNNMMSNAFTAGLFNPEMMANPQQMTNMLGGISSMSGTMFSTWFNNMFGGGP